MQVQFKRKIELLDERFTTFNRLETLQVNLGDMCNLRCAHCHHNASPQGDRIMGRVVMDKIAAFLSRCPGLTLDVTGGCPEMNPDFRYFIEATTGLASRRIVRSNLTIALEPGMEWLPDFYREQGLVVMASLPCYALENVEKQRGSGVFNRSIAVLRSLNRHGYGSELELHLVHNPGNGSVSGSRDMLEAHYRQELLQHFGIRFSRLHCMNNTPLGRFRKQLEQKGTYRQYIEQLEGTFNPEAAERIMCRTLISVGWDGMLYNCDFNLAATLPITLADGLPVPIDRIDEVITSGSDIRMADHCFSCTAGLGSGCGGAPAEAGINFSVFTDRHDQGVALCCPQS
jgi:radical SAM/Cys-rich protein